MAKDFERTAQVALMEENRRFALDKNQKVSGRVTLMMPSDRAAHLHTKNVRIRLQVENLRSCDPRSYKYKLMLLGLDKGRSLHRVVGEIKANNNGQVQETFELDSENVDGKGAPLTCFFIFMIVAISSINRNEPFHPILKGDWDNKWHDSKPEPKSEPKPKQAAAHVREDRQNQKTYNGYYNVYVKQMTDDLVKRKDDFQKTVPFSETWIADNWRRIALNSLGDAKAAGLFPVASLGAADQIEKYGHFIFAFNDEYFLLGIPGTHSEEDQPDRGESGFVLWQPIKDSDYYGYWLMMIQRSDGLIVGS